MSDSNKKWNIIGVVTASKYIGTVEAKTKKEAIRKAWETLDCDVRICHHCAEQCEDATIEELLADPEEHKR